ncbi:MAG: GNAT family N-acetyltransferase [Acidobacteria bacterium]|nr:GNAT family N-acetyltransferase [Acidobacteriota bacterium]
MNEIEIRQCTSHDEFRRCIELERAIWQCSDLDLIPLHSYVVIRGSGGFTLGAFTADTEMVGFALALSARRGEKLCYYSYMLAVTPEYQRRDIGKRLKFAQRDWALSRGIDLIVWTFDPMQALNAHFNITKLGAIAQTYEVNYYSSESSSRLHAGMDTDRLLAEWWLTSDAVQSRVTGSNLKLGPAVAQVRIPANVNALKATDVERARAWQLQVRQQFLEHFASGLYVGRVEPLGDGATYQYLLYRPER